MAAAASRLASNPLAVTWLAAGAAAVLLAVAFLRRDGASGVHPHDSAQTRIDVADVPEPKQTGPAAPTPTEVASAVPPLTDVTPAPIVVPKDSVAAIPPVVAPKPPASPPVDPRDEIAARLSQRVLRFEQVTPVAFETLRLQLEDLAGVTIRYGEAVAPEFRQAPIKLAVTDTTLAGVLDEAAGQAGLGHVVEATGVTLVPAGETDPATEPVSTATP